MVVVWIFYIKSHFRNYRCIVLLEWTQTLFDGFLEDASIKKYTRPRVS